MTPATSLACVQSLAAWQQIRQGLSPCETLALVPTMGALHAGHLALVQQAKRLADCVVVSIFVNPLQFGPSEDFAKYPRMLETDLQKCAEAGVDWVFAPSVDELYPAGETTVVTPPPSLTEQFCGLDRPGHFTGVATVVLKLFNVVQPKLAIFGEKDAQQVAVIRRMVEDLNLPVEIVSHPTVRESDGLALSSRNQYLTTPSDRQTALVLSQTLYAVARRVAESSTPLPAETTLTRVLADVCSTLSPEQQARFQLDYLAAVDRSTFNPKTMLDPDTRVLMAARVGNVRLIDNLDLSQNALIDKHPQSSAEIASL